MLAYAAVIGALAGALIGTVGIGAGALMVPALMFFTGLDMQAAVGVTLAMQTLPVGIGGAYVYYRRGLIDLRVVTAVGVGMLVGILAGAALATAGGVTKGSARANYLELALGGVLIVLGSLTAVKAVHKLMRSW
jgi:uncharacterized membrane protein YfcA